MTVKFLIAHPDHFTSRAVEIALRDLRYNTRHARDGLDAIDQALDDLPDGIILGTGLPGLNGLDAARAMRALTPLNSVPILFVTTDAHDTLAVKQAGLPLVAWVEAPLDLTLFRQQVTQLLGAPANLPSGPLTDTERQLAAISDPLTGLYARAYILHRLTYEAARAVRYAHPTACVLIGIDYYDELVNKAGSAGTDWVLVVLANLLRRGSRMVDLIGRSDRDEFVIIAPHTQVEGALALAERTTHTIHDYSFEVEGHRIRVTVSAGISVSEGASLSDNLALYGRALAALERAREAVGRPIVVG